MIQQSGSATQLVADVAPNPGEDTIIVGPLEIRFLLTGKHSNQSAALFEVKVPAGGQLPGPPHSHDSYEETIYGLRGVLTWTVNGEQFPVSPGQALCIPRGAVHRFDNFGVEDSKVLVVATPAGIGPDYFHEVAAVLNNANGGAPDREKLGEIMRRHGLTPVAAEPPPAI